MSERRLRDIPGFLIGLVVLLTGYGMWRSPSLDWIEFNAKVENLLVMLKNEVIRLSHDPFAILGLVVMLGGVYVVFDYGENLIFGVNTAGE